MRYSISDLWNIDGERLVITVELVTPTTNDKLEKSVISLNKSSHEPFEKVSHIP